MKLVYNIPLLGVSSKNNILLLKSSYCTQIDNLWLIFQRAYGDQYATFCSSTHSPKINKIVYLCQKRHDLVSKLFCYCFTIKFYFKEFICSVYFISNSDLKHNNPNNNYILSYLDPIPCVLVRCPTLLRNLIHQPKLRR